MTRTRRAVTIGAVAALTAAVVAPVVSVLVDASPSTPGARAAGLRAFDDCADLEHTLRTLTLRQVTAYGLGLPTPLGLPPGAEALGFQRSTGDAVAEGQPGAAGPGPAVGSNETGTNVQEAGVDEPDLAKTDGRYVFTLSGEDTLQVVDTSTGRPEATSVLRLPADTWTQEMLLVGQRLLLLGTDMLTGTTRLSLVDVSTPASPRLLESADVTGSYVTAREHDGLVRLVVTSQPRLRFEPPAQPGAFAERSALERNRAAVRRATAETWLPRVVVRAADGDVRRSGPLVGCGSVTHPDPVAAPSLVTVVTVDPSDGFTRLPSTAVTATGDLVYSSTARLYVATVDAAPVPLPAVAEPAPLVESRPSILPQQMRTGLHAFDISGTGAARYVASGSVPGWLLSRWAMSEHEGLLRVATTRTPTPTPGAVTAVTDSAVTVLAERGDRLVQMGRVGGLGPGESIRAVRWFGDLATVVTFRQTDPVYTVDLADPARPRVLGELKIPGFSAYLHPLGDDLLLGVGQDGDANGVMRGLAVSAFDLSDLANPTRVDVQALDAVWSPVLDESRAFTYLPEHRLAFVPTDAWAGDSVAVLRVGADGSLDELDRLAIDAPVQRVLPVGDRLAAVAGDVIALYETDTLRETGTLRLG